MRRIFERVSGGEWIKVRRVWVNVEGMENIKCQKRKGLQRLISFILAGCRGNVRGLRGYQ